MIIIDTCVLSEVRQKKPNRVVLDWFRDARDYSLYLSAMTLGELRTGAAQLADVNKALRVRAWVEEVERDYEDHVLAVSSAIAQLWGEKSGELRRKGVQLKVVDGLIAATALHHNMYVATRNVRDFEATGVKLINPWEVAAK